MTLNTLQREITDRVALVTLDRPESLNAINSEMLAELEWTLNELDGDPAVRAVILTGAGEKAFVAGGDIREMASMNSTQAHRFALRGQRVMLAMEKMSKPLIAAVNGFALGGGLELALGCDFIYSSEKARMGFPEVTLGVIPGFGGTQNLGRAIGRNRANELILSGRIISAEKACMWGIVNAVFPPGELLEKARETASAIAGAGPLGVAYAKDAIANGLDMAKEDGFRYEASLFGVMFSTDDQKEGMKAFVEKRRAEFSGK
jgi:enoyl-CoA hydratase